MAEAAFAVGRLEPDGAWIALRPTAGGWELFSGAEDEPQVTATAEPDDLVCAALLYFEEGLDPSPAWLEATQEDLGRLIRWLWEREPPGDRRRLLGEALDSIDDGLGADEVMGRLAAVLPPGLRSDPAGHLAARLGIDRRGSRPRQP